MIIGIDTRIPTKNKTGMGYLLDNLIPLIVEEDNSNIFKLLGSGFGINKKNVRIITLPKIIQRGFNFLWKNIFFPPVNFLIGKTDIFFFTNFVDIPVTAEKKVLLIPDVAFKKFPQFIEKKNLVFLNKNVSKAIARSDKIITISENAKKEICKYYKIPSEKVEVVYLGCPKNVEKVKDKNLIEVIKKKYGIEGKYILFVGTLEPRKNLSGLIEAYNSLDDKLKQEYQLVLGGAKGWHYDKIFDIVKKYQLENRVVFTGYIDENDRSAVYSGSSLFVYPSFYEGFGIPVLEAFTCGIPVVCADTSSLPEAAGDAAEYCQPDVTDSIKEAIKKVLGDKKIQNEMIAKGYKRKTLFSWEKSAKKILNILIK
ncbi:MAG: glycosyltransferase family 1 protein [Patescibacteria group bacterium]|nr:glycosyltransferase family 1 protein [Patescibacteria group bacterium]